MKSFWEEVEEGIWDEDDNLKEENIPVQQEEQEEEYYNTPSKAKQIAMEDDYYSEEEEEEVSAIQPEMGRAVASQPVKATQGNLGNFTNELVQLESGGNYKATNPNSSASGKYQFLWGTWGPEIKQVTGVESQQEFLNNPQAQDMFYNDYYLPMKLKPAVGRLQRYAPEASFEELGKLYHLRGEKGAMEYLTGKASDQPESFNMPTSKYSGIKRQWGVDLAGDLDMPEQYSYKPKDNSFSLTKGSQLLPDNLKISNITESSPEEEELYDFGIVEDITNLVDKGRGFLKENSAKAANVATLGIEAATDVYANLQNTQNHRKRLKLMQNTSYFPVNKSINNIPIYT